MDRVEPGQELDVERLDRRGYRLIRREAPRNDGAARRQRFGSAHCSRDASPDDSMRIAQIVVHLPVHCRPIRAVARVGREVICRTSAVHHRRRTIIGGKPRLKAEEFSSRRIEPVPRDAISRERRTGIRAVNEACEAGRIVNRVADAVEGEVAIQHFLTGKSRFPTPSRGDAESR